MKPLKNMTLLDRFLFDVSMEYPVIHRIILEIIMREELHERIQKIKLSEEVGVRYMQAWEEKVLEIEAAKQDGHRTGLQEGQTTLVPDPWILYISPHWGMILS